MKTCDAPRPWCHPDRILQAMVLINDLELVDNADFFETRLKAGGVLDVAEKYPWTGEMVLLDSLKSNNGIRTRA